MGRQQDSPPGERSSGRSKLPSAKALLNTDRQTTAPSPLDDRPTQPLQLPGLRTQQTPPLPPLPTAPPRALPRRIEPWDTAAPPQPKEPKEHRGVVRTWLFVALAVLVVVALIVGATQWLAAPPDDGRQAVAEPAGSEETSPPSSAQQGPLIERLPKLPGKRNRISATFNVSEGVELKLYSPGEATLFDKHDVRRVTWMGSAEGEIAYALLVAETDDAAIARATTKDLERFSTHGLDETDIPGHAKLHSYRKVNSSANLFFTVYTSGKYTVRVAVARIPPGDPSALAKKLGAVLTKLKLVLPPD